MHILIYIIWFWLNLVYACADLPSETVFLTWQRSPHTTMTIQWISATQDNTELEYSPADRPQWQKILGSRFLLSNKPSYFLHRVELINLKPNTPYQFKLSNQIYKFRTLPERLDASLRFVVGGDMYHENDATKAMRKTCKVAAQTNPHFALVGGDIAYAVRSSFFSSEKISRWIEWVQAWSQTMVAREGFLIPVIAAIGNHDIEGQYRQKPEKARIFSLLFPMPGKQIYNVLDFGSYLSLFILDSCHANPIGGEQTRWLNKVLQERQNMQYRFAIYHVPAYPSVRQFNNEYSEAIRKNWVPEFEKGGIQIAFEHHDHAYKRTYPLLQNKPNDKGVLYIGDGAWGVDEPRRPSSSEKRTYIAKFIPSRHFNLVTLDQERYSVISIDDNGKHLDCYGKEMRTEKLNESVL